MARSFATTDKVVTASFSLPTALSCYFWSKGTADFGQTVGFGNADPFLVYFNTTLINMWRGWTVSGLVASNATHGATRSAWAWYGVTHDGTTAVPKFYVNGGSAITGSAWSPSGTLVTGSGVFAIGNKNDGSQPSGNSEAYIGLHNVELTEAEMKEAYAYGYTPRGNIGFYPLWGVDSPEPDYSGNRRTGTVTGTTAVTGPAGAPIPTLIPQELVGFAADQAAAAAAGLTLRTMRGLG